MLTNGCCKIKMARWSFESVEIGREKHCFWCVKAMQLQCKSIAIAGK